MAEDEDGEAEALLLVRSDGGGGQVGEVLADLPGGVEHEKGQAEGEHGQAEEGQVAAHGAAVVVAGDVAHVEELIICFGGFLSSLQDRKRPGGGLPTLFAGEGVQ